MASLALTQVKITFSSKDVQSAALIYHHSHAVFVCVCIIIQKYRTFGKIRPCFRIETVAVDSKVIQMFLCIILSQITN